MARDTADDTPIESRNQLAAHLEAGGKPRAAWRIGTEHEKFGFYKDGHTPVPYQGPRGIRALLEGMQGLLGWEPIRDGENIIGLADPIGGGAISLEPGGQFELSGAPLRSLHQTCREVHAHLAQVRQVADPLGIGFLGLGMSPKWKLSETPVMPKSRYKIMANYMPKVGKLGRDMMFRTCTVQVNLDFSDEADMRDKMRVGLALQPIATALFANSPFTENRPNGFLSYRSEIWRDTDPNRTGMLPFAFLDGFGFEKYVDWALDVPMYFAVRDGRYHDMTNFTFRQFMEGLAPNDLPSTRGRRWATGRTTSRRFSRRSGSRPISRCVAPTACRGGGSVRCRRYGWGSSTTRPRSTRRRRSSPTGRRRSGRRFATRCRRRRLPRSSEIERCSILRATSLRWRATG